MGNVYFIRSKDRIKIGYSENVIKRKSTLQTGSGNLLTIEYIIEDVEPHFEKHVHSICKRYLIRNEWFTDDVLNHLLNHPWYKENMKSKLSQ
jgi:hypothetical protein